MRLRGVTTLVVVCLALAALLAMPSLAFADDSYPVSNFEGQIVHIDSGPMYHTTGIAQTFTAVQGTLDSAEFDMAESGPSKNFGPVGSLSVSVYPCTETGEITGPALATSESRTVASLNTIAHQLTAFTFASPPALASGQTYLLALEGTPDVAWAEVSIDGTDPTHAGVCLTYDVWAEGWVGQDYDLIFYVHQTPGAGPAATPAPASSVWSVLLLMGLVAAVTAPHVRPH